jgi:putative lipase involved disintegration of autophagic bodies
MPLILLSFILGLTLASNQESLELSKVLHYNSVNYNKQRLIYSSEDFIHTASSTPHLTITTKASSQPNPLHTLEKKKSPPLFRAQNSPDYIGPSNIDSIVPLLDAPTLLNLAYMSSNAYNRHDDPEEYSIGRYSFEFSNMVDKWRDLDGKWQTDVKFGWDSDGLRGYIFHSPSLVVIAFKGTSYDSTLLNI